ncbi:DUF5711 family protein [Blautia sp. XA-2221]|uniref:DUF5711 family protein n=1 Tax=Blautia sp. XA-2221 TaxID=2903961 RepID=UPI002379FAFF|nr:DUF5711 family protein [Blautia sp. XA-2221]
MAQNGKLSRDVGSEEEYRRQLSMHKIAAMKKTAFTVAVVAAVAVGVVFFIEKRSYRTYDIIQTSEQEDIVSTKYEVMSGKILRYSPDGAALVNSEMDAYWSTLYEMQNPVADIRGDWAVIADVDGTSMEIFDKDGEVGSVTTSYSIVKARISSNGLVAAILDGGDSTWINYYDSDGSLIAENQTHVEDPGYPMDVAVSDNGEIMMVTYQFIDGSDTTSYVAFYNFGDVGQNEDDRIVSGYTYEGVVIPEIRYFDTEQSVALREDGFTVYKGRQIPKESATEKVDKEIVSTFCDDDTIGMVFKNGNKDKQYTMKVYSVNGSLRFTKDFNIPYTTIKISGGNILLYNDSQICVMNSRGVEKYSGTVDGSINNFIKIGWNRYLLVLDSGVNVIKFS